MYEKGFKIGGLFLIAAITWFLVIFLLLILGVAPQGNHTGDVAVYGFAGLFVTGLGILGLSSLN
jgi:hypothetical protein